MKSDQAVDLYALMPSMYRIRDAKQGAPLRALLEIIAEQAGLVKDNIDALWDDFFIETCEEWVIPYIGDLVANNQLHDVSGRQRADVAKTIYYRRRKGTLAVLEQIAEEVTGWGAHGVNFFEAMDWTQNLNHLRISPAANLSGIDPDASDRVGTVNLRNLDALAMIGGPFDQVAHTVDVRPIGQAEGWYDIRNVGFFLWRLGSFLMSGVAARRSATYADGFHFSPLGSAVPLFTYPRRQPGGGALTEERDVPGPIRNEAFYFRPGDYYGADQSLAIFRAGDSIPVPLADILCMDLSSWSAPPIGKVAIDVRLGRFAFAPGESRPGGAEVLSAYGFSGATGGGPYERRRPPGSGDPHPDTIANPDALGVLIDIPPGTGSATGVLTGTLAGWNQAADPRAVIQVNDNRTYIEDVVLTMAGEKLVLQARNQCRPTVLGDITINGTGGTGQVELNGFLVAGTIHVKQSLGKLVLSHCTLVPGAGLTEDGLPLHPARPSLLVDSSNDALQIEIDHCTTGPLRPAAANQSLTIRDSIVDSLDDRVLPALVSGPLSALAVLTGATPTLMVTIGKEGPFAAVIDVATAIVDFADLAARLQAAIRVAHASPAFAGARVQALTYPNRLLVASGGPMAIHIDVAGADPSATSLKLDPASGQQILALIMAGQAAIESSPGADTAGPPTTLERVTVFGRVHVRELPLASETIFTGLVTSDRLQNGCVRFSYVPAGSRTPRLYRCQPQQAVEATTDPQQQATIRAELQPVFTSQRYGDPGYGQLSLACAGEIRTGAEDGSEMGAFSMLRQPQRETNLRIRLEEYLPAGREAGLIYVT